MVAGEVAVRPDIVSTRARVAVVVDGCFLAQLPVARRAPKSNLAYWIPKLKGNRARDVRVNTALTRKGRVVVRIWEQ